MRVVWILSVLLSAGPASAAALGPWTVGPMTNGSWTHNGLAGVPGYLYVLTGGGTAEVSAIQPDGSLGEFVSAGGALNFPHTFGSTLATADHLYIAGGWAAGPDPGAGGAETATVEAGGINPAGTLTPRTPP